MHEIGMREGFLYTFSNKGIMVLNLEETKVSHISDSDLGIFNSNNVAKTFCLLYMTDYLIKSNSLY